jgi:hypothetical protein
MEAMIAEVTCSTNLPKDAVQQTRGQGSGIRDRGLESNEQLAHCNAMIAEVCRSASLKKDEVQRSAPVPTAGRQARGAETARFCRSPHA